ncbi:MAG: sulfatase [Planctomycetota bacterium]|jgi:arylsulfatase A-like enzyme
MTVNQNSADSLSRRKILKYGLYGSLATPLAPALWLSGCPRWHQVKKPNIIFILIDALRADRTGLYGYNRNTTTTIDAVAKGGVIFDRALSQSPWTQPSIASLFCSRYPSVHKVLNIKLARAMRGGQAQKMPVFTDSFTTLAEVLHDSGYETAGFIANFLMSGYYGFAQGFDLYSDMPSRNLQAADVSGDVLNKEVVTWLKRRRSSRPLFLYVHYMDVHGPYYSRPQFYEPFFEQVEKMPDKRKLSEKQKQDLGYLAKVQAAPIVKRYNKLAEYLEFWSAFYDAGIREADLHVSELIADLKDSGIWDNSYVIITADHGEELQEHGYWDHGYTLYQTELHVPLIMCLPGGCSAGKRIKTTVRLIDIMPTLLDELGIPDVAGMQGHSFKDAISGHQTIQCVPAFSEAVKVAPLKKSLYFGDWKLIITKDRKTHELYNISDDPMEQKNVFAQNPEQARKLNGLLREQRKQNYRLALKTEAAELSTTREQYEKLKSLGYVR